MRTGARVTSLFSKFMKTKTHWGDIPTSGSGARRAHSMAARPRPRASTRRARAKLRLASFESTSTLTVEYPGTLVHVLENGQIIVPRLRRPRRRARHDSIEDTSALYNDGDLPSLGRVRGAGCLPVKSESRVRAHDLLR